MPLDLVRFVDEAIRKSRLVAVIRAPSTDAALAAARAVVLGGLPVVEITYSVPDAPSVMRAMGEVPGAVVGAGTVLTAEQAHAAVDAGARFLIAPNVDLAVAEIARSRGVFYCPGAYTTTEILAARRAGAHLVKVYPVGIAGGPDYIKVIRDPLPDIPYLAAGGTSLSNVAAFLGAGCIACGLGASLADPAISMAGHFDEITARTRAFISTVTRFGTATSPPA